MAAGTSAPKTKHEANHPTYNEMVKSAIQSLKERKGSSKAAILKYILNNYDLGDNVKMVNAHIRTTLTRGVASGFLNQVKGDGASGSFRLGETAKKSAAPRKRSAAPKPKKPAPPKAEKAAPKAKKEAPAKPKKAASPKKAKSPAKSSGAEKAATSLKKAKVVKKSPVKKAASARKKASPQKKKAAAKK